MKNLLKILLIALVLTMAICAFAFASYAEDEYLSGFSVYDKEGNPTEISGDTFDELRAAAPSLSDGDTIVFNANMEAMEVLYFESEEETPRTINIDLNGNKIYTTKKLTPGLINSGSYTTLNVYSSREGGVIYCTCLSDIKLGSPIFNVRGNSSVLNVGDFADGETMYPGSNISTYSACLIDIVVDNETVPNCIGCEFNVNGGNYYSISSDYSGYIIPRGGEITMNINNANIISMETKAPINSAGKNTVLNLTDCCIIQYDAQPIKLFNNVLGTVNMKDCITTYMLAGASGGMGNGVVHLEGKNVFAAEGEEDYTLSLLSESENLVAVTTYSDFELTQGITELYYFDNTASLIPLTEDVPKLAYPSMLVPSDDVVKYKFVKGQNTISQSWANYEEPAKPFDLPVGGEDGVYKYGWHKEVDDIGVVIYTVGYIADYNLKVRAVYEGDELYFKLYAPAEIVDGGYIDFVNVLIQGEGFAKKDWGEEEIDGVKYCYAVTEVIYPENADEVITVRIPCDYGRGVYVDTTWSFTVSNYINEVLKTESEELYTEEQYALVHEIGEAYLSKNDQTDTE